MMKYTEFFVVLCTLTAIISTFFLYRTHVAPSHMAAAVINSLPIARDSEQYTSTEETTNGTDQQVSSADKKHSEVSGVIVASVKNEHKKIPDAALVTKIDSNDTHTVPIVDASYQYSLETLSSNIHSRTNISRSQNHLPSLTYDKTLAQLAELRSEDMVKHDYFSHTTPEKCDLGCRFKASSYISLSWGENLAEFSDYSAQSETELAKIFMDKWIASSEHRDNLFSKDYNREGVGVAIKDKRIVVTVIFAKQ